MCVERHQISCHARHVKKYTSSRGGTFVHRLKSLHDLPPAVVQINRRLSKTLASVSPIIFVIRKREIERVRETEVIICRIIR